MSMDIDDYDFVTKFMFLWLLIFFKDSAFED